MALVKSVEIDIGVKGDTASKAKLDAISARAEELKKAFPEYALKIDSAAATERLAVFRGQVKATADAASKPIDTVILTDKAKAKLLEVETKAEKLKRDFPSFTLRIDDAAAKRKLAIFAAEAKATTDIVDRELSGSGGGGAFGKLGTLFGSGGGGGAAGGGSSLLSGGLTSPAGIAGIGGLAALAAALVPGLVGFGLGGGVGAAAAGGSILAGNTLQTQIKSLQSQISAAQNARNTQSQLGLTIAALQQRIGIAQGSGATKAQRTALPGLQSTLGLDQLKFAQGAAALPAQRLGLGDNRQQLARDTRLLPTFQATGSAFSGLTSSALQTFTAAIAPIQKPLQAIFGEMAKQIKLLGPVLAQVFDASLPFIKVFAGLMLQMGKSLLPAINLALNEMVGSGALKEMTQGLVILIKGFAGFITALGPGMASSAKIFTDLMVILAASLRGLGLAVSWTANVLENFFHRFRDNIHVMAAQFDDFRHRTAVVFDGIRHDIAHIWDLTWQNTIGRLIRFVADDQRMVNNFRHAIAGTFDGARHDIAARWNAIWSQSIAQVRGGISTVVGWFRGLPGRAVGALFGLGHSLAAFASAAINQMGTGFRNTFSSVIHWFQGLPRMILHALGVHSPPGWAVSAGKWIMKGLHIGLGHGLGQLTSFTTSIGAQVAGALSGALGGHMGDSGARTHSAAVAQAYARSLLSQYGWSANQMSSLIPLWNQESGWSAYAVNQSSGAYGIPQSLGHGHPYNLGDYKNQIIWGLNYIRGRYGSPAAAERHELAYNWYDKGGWLMPGLTLAMNKTGKPEQILPPGRSAATPVVLQVRAPHGATNLERALVEIIQKFVTVQGGDVQSALGRT